MRELRQLDVAMSGTIDAFELGTEKQPTAPVYIWQDQGTVHDTPEHAENASRAPVDVVSTALKPYHHSLDNNLRELG